MDALSGAPACVPAIVILRAARSVRPVLQKPDLHVYFKGVASPFRPPCAAL